MLSDEVRENTAVRTGVESRAELTFTDQTLARLGANTIFSFNEGTRNLDLGGGAMLLRVPKNSGGAQINTAAVTAAITGTTVMLEYHPDAYIKFIILEGTGRIFRKDRVGESVLLHAGQMLIVNPKGKTLPEPVDVDLKRLMKTSLLITDFPQIASLDLIRREIATQTEKKSEGGLADTNLVIFGGGTAVSLLDPTHVNTIDQATDNTSHAVGERCSAPNATTDSYSSSPNPNEHAATDADRNAKCYPYSNRNTYPDAKRHTHSDTNSNCDPNFYTFPYSDPHLNSDSNSNPHAHFNPDPHAYAYADPNTNTNTNPNTHTHAHSDSNSNTHPNTHTHSDSRRLLRHPHHTNTYTYTDAHSDSDAHADPNANSNSNSNSNTNPDPDPDSDSNRDAYANPHTNSDSDPYADAHANTHANSDSHPDTKSYSNARSVDLQWRHRELERSQSMDAGGGAEQRERR